jgi:hypothetical protein
MLDSAMATAGVMVGREWSPPLVALLAPDGELVGETQGSVPSASRLIERLRARGAQAGK